MHTSSNLLLNSAGVDSLRSFFAVKGRRTHFLKIPSTWLVFLAIVTPGDVSDSPVDCALSFMAAYNSGSVQAFPLRENMHWMYLLGLRLRPFSLDHSEAYLRALYIMEMPWGTLQGWPMTTSSACLRTKANDSEKRWEVWRVKKRKGKEQHFEEHHCCLGSR